MLGFMVGSIPGAIIGGWFGHLYDRYREMTEPLMNQAKAADAVLGETREQIAFSVGVIVLAAKLAKVDGAVTRDEIDAFKRIFRIRPEQEIAVGRLFDQARNDSVGFEPYARQLATIFAGRTAVLEELLGGLMLVAAADNNGITAAELGFLRQVANYFGFDARTFGRILALSGVRLSDEMWQHAGGRGEAPRAPPPPRDNPYEILGIDEASAPDAIKSAYRKLIREHHPDKLVAAGLPKELVEQATERMKKINAAYDAVCKERGMN
jgi:DnaJ like chaperone protein